MKINTDLLGWVRVALFVFGTGSMWRMALVPQGDEPRKRPRRSLIFFGAFLLTIVYHLHAGSDAWILDSPISTLRPHYRTIRAGAIAAL
jgi:hypothetical protein